MAGLLGPPGGDVIFFDTHRRFIEHMGELHAAYWRVDDTVALSPIAHHYVFLTPAMAALEAAHGGGDPVPKAVEQGWAALSWMDSRLSTILTALAGDPSP